MESSRRAEHHSVIAVRKCLTVGFWLLAASAATALGLDLEADPRL